jgi:glutamyl-tRNA synthetase
LLLRFDDTNPANEKEEFADAILNDLQILGVSPTQVSHTSDHFDMMLDQAKELIKKGLAFCDWSTQVCYYYY